MKKKLLCLITILMSSATYAQFATGSGKYTDQIFWLSFLPQSAGGALVEWPGMPTAYEQNSTILPGNYIWSVSNNIRVRATISNITGELYIKYDDFGNFNYDYSNLTLNHFSTTSAGGGLTSFDITIIIETLNNEVWTPVIPENQGLVVADSESLAYDVDEPEILEYIRFRTPNTSQLYLIDGTTYFLEEDMPYGMEYIIEQTDDFVNNEKIMTIYIGDAIASDWGFHSIIYAKGATTFREVALKGGGITTLSLGVFTPTIKSTAPISYGEAVHLQEVANFGELTPLQGVSNLSSFRNSEDQIPDIEFTSITNFNPTPLISLPKLFTDASTPSFNIEFPALNDANVTSYVYAWIDINGDGFFSEDESVSLTIPPNTGLQNISIPFPQAMYESATPKDSYLRIRVTTEPLINQNGNPTIADTRSFGYSSNGYVYDQPIRITESTLPIQLIEFNVKAKGSFNEITWKTSNELNNSHFEILKSTNVENQWVSIGRVEAIQNSNLTKEYRFEDHQLTSLTNYYRLMQVDVDGQETLYGIYVSKFINESENESIKIYPSPFINQFVLETNIQQNDQYSVEIYSMNGTKVYQQFYRLNAGIQKINITGLGNLLSGTYILKFNNNKQTLNSNLIIKL